MPFAFLWAHLIVLEWSSNKDSQAFLFPPHFQLMTSLLHPWKERHFYYHSQTDTAVWEMVSFHYVIPVQLFQNTSSASTTMTKPPCSTSTDHSMQSYYEKYQIWSVPRVILERLQSDLISFPSSTICFTSILATRNSLVSPLPLLAHLPLPCTSLSPALCCSPGRLILLHFSGF